MISFLACYRPKMSRIWMQQLQAILWKAWVIRRRHYISLAFEVLIPISLVLLAVYSVSAISSDVGDHKNNPFGDGPLVTPETEKMREGGFEPPTIYEHFIFDMASFVYSLGSKDVLFTPNNVETQRFIKEMRDMLNLIFGDPSVRALGNLTEFEGVDSEDEFQLRLIELNNNTSAKERYIGGIAFMKVPRNFAEGENQTHFHYKIRVKNDLMLTSKKWAVKKEAGPRGFGNPYIEPTESFLSLQILVNEAYLNLKAKDSGLQRHQNNLQDFQIFRTPYPKYRASPKSTLVDLIPILITNGLIVAFLKMVKTLAEEKNNRSKEMFRMMGLNDWMYWIGNFLHNWIFFFGLGFVLLCLLFFHFTGNVYFINYSSFGPLVILFLVYTTNVVLFGCLLSIPFSSPVLASVLAVVGWIASNIPSQVLNPRLKSTSNMKRLSSCLLPNTALSWALQVVSQKEMTGEGLHFYNINDETALFEGMTFLLILVLMLVSCLILSMLIWYLDNVWPFQPGVPKKPWFLFTPSYWSKKYVAEGLSSQKDSIPNPKYYEAGDETKPVAIRLSHVTKTYGGLLSERKVAVDDLSIDVYQDELTCLLGHNGAGKTTTMSMMTGMFPPSSGRIFVDGYDLFTQTSRARQSMSLCPQHNPLYTELTVREHLYLYARIKGFPSDQVNDEVEKTIAEITLKGHEDKLAPTLSGGMKRKLCLGMALVGGSKVVILDEPTSGLDVEVRRSIWDVLRESRKTRTILLSTHDMEEADALADRIIIMSEGQTTCAGSTMFLKRAFGAGYVLRIAKTSQYMAKDVERLILSYFPESKLKTNVGTEISFSLESENNTTDSSQLPSFFKELETNKQKLGIESFGLSITTMEEVFLKVGELAGNSDEVLVNSINHSASANEMTQLLNDNKEVDRIRFTGWQLEMQRIKGLFFKRLHFSKRDWKMAIFQILIPALLFVGGFSLSSSIFAMSSPEPPLDMNMFDIYGRTQVFFQTNTTDDNFLEFYQGSVKETKQDFSVFPANVSISSYLVNKSESMTLNDFVRTYLVGLETVNFFGRRTFRIWSNDEADHSLPLAVDMLYRALDYELTQDPKPHFLLTNQPLAANDEFITFKTSMEVMDILWCIILPITVPFLAASYIMFPVHERTSKAKLIQLMTGLHPNLLHFVNFMLDFILHVIATVIIIAVFVVMDTQEFFTRNAADMGSMVLLLLLFGISSIIMAYIFSNMFSKQASGFTFLVTIYLITGLVFSITALVLKLLSFTNNDVKNVYETVLWIFRFFPLFSMQIGFRNIYRNGGERSICTRLDPKLLEKICNFDPSHIIRDSEITTDITPEYGFSQHCCPKSCKVLKNCVLDTTLIFDDRGIGKELLMMFISIIISAVILLLVEVNWSRFISYFTKSRPPVVELNEEDVLVERDRIHTIVEHGSFVTEALSIDRLTKKFPKTFAVKGVSFGVHHKECFGLLGVNGAGKTTTFGECNSDSFIRAKHLFLINRHDHRRFVPNIRKCISVVRTQYCWRHNGLPATTGILSTV